MVADSPRFLTKSRFLLGLECPTKLFYTGKPDYVDNSLEDSFLAALAEGGYQVGALARLMYPGGIEVEDAGHAAQIEHTRSLLQDKRGHDLRGGTTGARFLHSCRHPA